jgi:hypothetical protein
VGKIQSWFVKAEGTNSYHYALKIKYNSRIKSELEPTACNLNPGQTRKAEPL